MRSRAEPGGHRAPEREGRGTVGSVASVLLALVGLCLPPVVQAQAPDEGGAREATEGRPLVLRADRLYFSARPDSALALLSAALQESDSAYPALWRRARVSVALALTVEDREERRRRLKKAIDDGRRAVDAGPEGVEGHYWLAAGAGLLAMHSPDGGEAVELGREARTHARRTLELDPEHGGAHNVLGMVHFEVMKLSGWKRWIAGILGAGDVVEGASWETAEAYLREAVELAPDMVYFRLGLARLLSDRERPEEAAAVLRELLELPGVHPSDPVLKERARRLLHRLEADAAAGSEPSEPGEENPDGSPS